MAFEALQRRAENIARLKGFFDQVFGDEESEHLHILPRNVSKSLSSDDLRYSSGSSDITKKLQLVSSEIARLRNILMYRESEVDYICSQLRQMRNSSPLLVLAHPGNGKTAIASEIAKVLSKNSTLFSCAGFSTVNQFYRELLAKVFQTIGAQQRRSMKPSFDEESICPNVTNNNIHQVPVRKMNSFYRFTNAFRDLLNSHFSLKYDSTNAYNNISDDNHSLDITFQLNTNESNSFILFLDDFQVVSEIDEDLEKQLLRLHEDCHPSIRVVALSRPHGRINNWNVFVLEMKPYTPDQLVDVVLTMAKTNSSQGAVGAKGGTSTDWMRFSQILRDTLLVLRIRTSDPREILAVVNHIYRLEAQGISGDGKESVAEMITSTSSRSKLAARFSLYPSLQIIDLPRATGSTSVAETSSAFDLSNYSEGIHKKWLSLKPSLCVQNWHEDLSVSSRFLILSGYLATCIPRKDDSLVFGDKRKGKRKRTRVGNEEVHDDLSSTHSPVFSTERLLMIYKSILHHGQTPYLEKRDLNDWRGLPGLLSLHADTEKNANQRITQEFGTAQLFATVNDLISEGFFTVVGTVATEMSLVCNVLDSDARDIAASLRFPLQSYFIR